MNKLINARYLMILGIILASAFARLIPHYPNVTPIAAMALFGGAYLKNRNLAFILPIAAMILSDIFLGFHESVWAVYLSVIFTAGFGILLSNKITLGRTICAALASSIIFYLITNFSVWLLSGMYSQDLIGLLSCYTLALPFLRNSVIGDLVYTGLLFGSYALISKYIASLRYDTILNN